jgi:hypothetical protein
MCCLVRADRCVWINGGVVISRRKLEENPVPLSPHVPEISNMKSRSRTQGAVAVNQHPICLAIIMAVWFAYHRLSTVIMFVPVASHNVLNQLMIFHET